MEDLIKFVEKQVSGEFEEEGEDEDEDELADKEPEFKDEL